MITHYLLDRMGEANHETRLRGNAIMIGSNSVYSPRDGSRIWERNSTMTFACSAISELVGMFPKTMRRAGLATWFLKGQQLSEASEVLEEADSTEPNWND